MEYIKKSLIVFFIFILSSFFILKYTVRTEFFNNNLEKILTSANMNIKIGKVNFKNIHNIEISNLEIYDQNKKPFLIAKKANAKISLLTPTRISKIDVYDAIVDIERYKENKLNVLNIVKPSQSKAVDNTSRIGFIYLHDSRLTYRDFAYDKKIEKSMSNVNGILDISKTRGFYINALAIEKDEKLDFKLALSQPKERLDIKSIFSKTKEYKSTFNMSFKFKNFKLFEEATQYIPYEDIIVYDGRLNGQISISKHVIGDLHIKDGVIEYNQYDGKISKIESDVTILENKLHLNANTTINKAPISFNMDMDLNKKLITMNLKGKKIKFEDISRYKIIKDLKIGANGKVNANLDMFVNIDKKEFMLDSKLSSDNIKYANYNFRNISANMKLSKDKILSFDNVRFIFDEHLSNFHVNNQVKTNLKYYIDAKKAEGKYETINLGSDYSINRLSGNYKINKDGTINIAFNSNETNGTVFIPKSKDKVSISAKSNNYITINFQKQKYELVPNLNNVVFNFKNGLLESGNINTQMKSILPQYYDSLNANIKINNGNYAIKANIKIGTETITAIGTTDMKMNHNYTINDNLKVENIAKRYGYNIPNLKMPISLLLHLRGQGNNLAGYFEAYSDYGSYIAEYEKLKITGKLNSVSNIDLDANIKIGELWAGYQRFKELDGSLTLSNNKLKINNLHNDKLMANVDYNLQSQKINVNSNLQNYIVYNVSQPEHNIYIDKAKASLYGKLGDLNGNINITPSKTTVNSMYIGDFEGNVDIHNNVLNVDYITLRDNKLSGTYNLNNGIANMSLLLKEEHLTDIYPIPELTGGIVADLKLKGHLNEFDLNGDMLLNNLSYKKYKIPVIKTDVSYEQGDISKLFKKGKLNINEFILIGDLGEEILNTKTQIDLENVDIDYKVENGSFSLDSIKDLKEKGYSGKVDYSFLFKGNFDNFYSDLKVKSKDVVLSGIKVNDLDIDAQANNKGINIGQLYVDYENNPLIINGFVDFSPIDFNIGVIADKFNLKFLETQNNVAQATGEANINLLFAKDKTSGKIKLDSFTYKTKDNSTNIENFVADIDILNTKLNVNKFFGKYNNGTFKINGDLDVPTIDPEFMKNRKIELGKFSLNVLLDNIIYKYSKGVDLNISSDLNLTENSLIGNLNINSGLIREVPNFNFGSGEESNNGVKGLPKEKGIVDSIQDAFFDKIKQEYIMDINSQILQDVKIEIPAYSVVRDIKGNLVGGSRLYYDSGVINLLGNYQIKKGTVEINNKTFNLEDAEIRFTDPLVNISQADPFVVLTATTSLDGEFIDIRFNGNISNPSTSFRSSSGMSQDQILTLLAFDVNVAKDEENTLQKNSKNNNILNSVLDTTLNQLIFLPVTGKIERTLGLTNFRIRTNLLSNDSQHIYDTLKNGSFTTLYVQDNIYKDKTFWNLELSFPIQTNTTTTTSTELDYNIWLNHKLTQEISFKLSGETIDVKEKGDTLSKNAINYYGGFDFSLRDESFDKIFRRIFKTKLKKIESKK